VNGQGENYSLRDITLSEDIFVREEVSAEETFKIQGLPLRPYIGTGERIYSTKTKVGLYQISTTMEEWSENLLGRLITSRDRLNRPLEPHEVGPICDIDPEWVNDDSVIIAQCHRECSGPMAKYSVILISDDRRLANQMAETCNVSVLRIRSRDYVAACTNAHLDPKMKHMEILTNKVKIREARVYIDTGSISANAVHLTEEDNKIILRKVQHTGWIDHHRYTRVHLNPVQMPSRFKTEMHRPVSRPKFWRSGSRPVESVYSSHSSWNRSSSNSSNSSWWRPSHHQPP